MLDQIGRRRVVPCTNTVPIFGWSLAELAHHVGAARGLEVRRHAQRRAIGDRDLRTREVQGDDRGFLPQARRELTTGTSLYSHGCRSITCPSGNS